ncbi:hypothetical protein TRIP_B330394 [uncultured Desulfatiglans sp.]|uniref:Uncharacterized protein n=1 Tax=Uncultured Desulfatiglans sp. TaxID=1748965 RepID=A0A653A836_UNCDX|nr:hypothetical protein TRIP_B330394 [uncultured Desulfatiglans sp.]
METESYRKIISGWRLFCHLGVNLHVCLWGDHQVASAQMLDFLDMRRTGARREALGVSTRSV